MSADRGERGAATRVGAAIDRVARWIGRRVRGEVVKRVGGPARARVIVIFGAVLALNGPLELVSAHVHDRILAWFYRALFPHCPPPFR